MGDVFACRFCEKVFWSDRIHLIVEAKSPSAGQDIEEFFLTGMTVVRCAESAWRNDIQIDVKTFTSNGFSQFFCDEPGCIFPDLRLI